mgnify:CR=1 FL=1|jgi:hypothetical protein
MYQTEFYMHAYSVLITKRESFLESKEGFTYITKESEEKITVILLKFCEANERINATRLIASMIQKIKINPMDREDTEYIDIDDLLKVYL